MLPAATSFAIADRRSNNWSIIAVPSLTGLKGGDARLRTSPR